MLVLHLEGKEVEGSWNLGDVLYQILKHKGGSEAKELPFSRVSFRSARSLDIQGHLLRRYLDTKTYLKHRSPQEV